MMENNYFELIVWIRIFLLEIILRIVPCRGNNCNYQLAHRIDRILM